MLGQVLLRANQKNFSTTFVAAYKTAAFLVAIFCSLQAAAAETPEVVPGEYIIKYAATAPTQSGQTQGIQAQSSKATVLANLGVSKVKTLNTASAELVKSKRIDGSYDDQYAKDLLASGIVEYIEPNYVIHALATPNDASYSTLWGMNNTGQSGGVADVDIDAPEAWNITTGSNSVVVGIVDTGISYTHPDLANNMWVNPGEIAGDQIDNDNNGVVDDVYGYNAITPTSPPLDDNNHGSHCAGTIGGVGNNSTGVVGVNWNVKMMALKFLSSSGSGSTAGAIAAIDYAVMMKNRGVNLRVLSNSWGGGGFSQSLKNSITAANTAGILFVAAAGNNAANNDITASYPANYPVANIISVAAIDRTGALASFSNYGVSTVHIGAPGVSILSTVTAGAYATFNGTSMATPHVAGVAALVVANEPTISLSALRARILSSVKPLPSLVGNVSSGGMVSAFNALTNTQAPVPSPTGAYVKTAATYAYETTLGTRVLSVDDGYSTQTLNFNFPFYGVNYSKLALSANGRVLPLRSTESQPTDNDYSNQLYPGLEVFNDDLFPSSVTTNGGVWFKQDSSSATVTWVTVPYALSGSQTSAYEQRFQLKVNSAGLIEYHYADVVTGNASYDYGASATVGISPASGAIGTAISVTSNVAMPSEINNSLAIRFSPAQADLTAPAAPVISSPIPGSVLRTALPTISGTAEVGATVSLYDDSSLLGTTGTNSSGTWSFTLAAPLTAGTHTFKATATDASNNVSNFSESVALTVEFLYTLTGKVTLNGVGLSGVSVDGSSLGVATTNSTGNYTFTNISEGTNFTLLPTKYGFVFTNSIASGTVNSDTTVNFTATELQQDSDSDGVSDSQELLDGTDPQDAGSYLSALNTTICSEWNGFLSLANILEHVDLGTSALSVTSRLYDISGSLKGTAPFTIQPGGQFDLLVNNVQGHTVDSYGKICSAYNGSPGDVDGRMVYYKKDPSGGDSAFQFAFAIPFQNPIHGPQHVFFNTFQPSANSSDSTNLAANWIQLTNNEPVVQTGSLLFYGQDGTLLNSRPITLEPHARKDFAAHDFGNSLVGMVKWSPADNTAGFTMRNVRYIYDNPIGTPSFDSAFQLEALVGSGRELVVPVDTRTDVSVLEIGNVKDSVNVIQISIYNNEGVLKYTTNRGFAPFESLHLVVNKYLTGSGGIATIRGNLAASTIATAMQYGRNSTGSIEYLYGIQAQEALGTTLRGSYNTFLGQSCYLQLSNPTAVTQSAAVSMVRLDGTTVLNAKSLTVPAHGFVDYNLCANDQANTYGVATLDLGTTNTLVAQVVRVGKDNQYRFPTPVR